MLVRAMLKTNSQNARIESFGDNNLLVYVSSETEKNEANIELIQMLSKYYGAHPNKIKIKSGFTDRNKLVEVI